MEDKIIEQWCKPMSLFKYNVKCCYNCPNWERDLSLMGDYAYNFCKENNQLKAFDRYCSAYCGTAQEENIIYDLPQEKRQELFEKYGN